MASAPMIQASSGRLFTGRFARPIHPGLNRKWWLGLALVLALAVRLVGINGDLHLDEYGPLYAVAEREGLSSPDGPTAADPLKPVPHCQDVPARSVLPYGIDNPIPLYHYLVYGVLQVLPVAEWSLRLPSLLAGLASVVVVYFWCRRLAGAEVARVAALLMAVDPHQIHISLMARPYGLGNLGCLLSFLALYTLLHTQRLRIGILGALGYGLSLTFVGYMNPTLLLVVSAQGIWVAWALGNQVRAPQPGSWWNIVLKGGGWLAGGALAGVLLLPERGYLGRMGQFYLAHRDYLRQYGAPSWGTAHRHNQPFLQLLLIILLVSGTMAWMRFRRRSSSGLLPGTDRFFQPWGNRELAWMAGSLLVVPQIVAALNFLLGGQAMFLTRYMCYTGVGGLLLLAYLVTRFPSRGLRTDLVAVLILANYLAFLTGAGNGSHLLSQIPRSGPGLARQFDQLDADGQWQKGDVLLYRSSFIEGDFLPDDITPENRKQVEKLTVGPLNLLYATHASRPIIVLSRSHYRSPTEVAYLGNAYGQRDRMYGPELVAKLQAYKRFWISSDDGDFRDFLKCVLPWMADALGTELQISVVKSGTPLSFTVHPGLSPGQKVMGLHDHPETDFTGLILIERKNPKPI